MTLGAGAPGVTAVLVSILGVLAAAFIKGAMAFGCPALSTPVLAVFMMDKAEFVRSRSPSVFVCTATQLVAVTSAGTLTLPLAALSVGATAAGLGGFWLGLRVFRALG